MEYRRRRTRTGGYQRARRQAGNVYPAYAAAFFVFVLVVYLISASRLGTWLANRVVAPAMLRVLPGDPTEAPATPTPVVLQTADNVTVKLEAYVCHALQIGVYSARENAEAQSESLKALGAAGYLLKDGERFRVLAAGYPLESDAQAVRQRLQTEGVDSRIHEVSGNKRTLTISASAADAGVIQNAAQGMKGLLDGLFDASIRFDRDTLSIDEGVVALHALQSEAREQAAVLREHTHPETDDMADFYESMEAEMEQTVAIEERTAFSAALKRLYLTGAMAYCAYLNGT